MDFNGLIDSITPELYNTLQRSLELGKWPDGNRLTTEQKEQVMQALIAYGERKLAAKDRIGFIDRGSKEEGELCDDQVNISDQPVKFLQ